MSIFINKDTKIITQGITGKTGQFHTEKCQEYANGKNCFVAGVNPKQGRRKHLQHPHLRYRQGSCRANRRHRFGHLRAPSGRGRCDLGSR